MSDINHKKTDKINRIFHSKQQNNLKYGWFALFKGKT